MNSRHVLVGSAALEELGYRFRKPADLDIWYYGDYSKPEGRVDAKEQPREIVDYVADNMSLDTLYTIKLAHAAWDIKWEKTMADMVWLQAQGAKTDETLYAMLVPHWEKVHGDKAYLSLKKTKEEFFTNNVSCPIDHDYIHELVAHYDKPLYTTVLKDGQDVLIDRDKFMALSEEDRLKMIREEVYVIALERWYIPLEGKIPTTLAYRRALKLVATRLTKGWFCRYLLEHFVDLRHVDRNHNFVKIFENRDKANDKQSINPNLHRLRKRAV